MPKLSLPDWINGDPVDLREWRDAQPDVVDAVMPTGLEIAILPPAGAFRGGQLFTPPRLLSKAIVVHFHGGGFVVGSPTTHRIVAASIAVALGCRVLLAQYRLAPEHTLPAQSIDAVAALEHARHLGPAVILSGDSAGTMIALWGYQFSAPDTRAVIQSCYLFYGVFGEPAQTQSGLSTSEKDGLGPRSIEAAYLRIDPNWRGEFSVAFSPFAAGFTFPPNLMVIGAGNDPLLEHSERLYAYLGNGPIFKVLDDKGHGFLSKPKPDVKIRAFLSELSSIAIAD